jgi:hypothetical protein
VAIELSSRPLTRKDLAEFLPSHRAIKAFESIVSDIRDILAPAIDTNSDGISQAQDTADTAVAAARLAHAVAELAATVAQDIAAGPPPAPAADELVERVLALMPPLPTIADLGITLSAGLPGILPVVSGGTGLSAGTSGGVPYFASATSMASSAQLSASALVIGGGAGGAPSTLGSLGLTTQVLHGNAGGAPSWGAVSLTADVSGTLPVGNGGTGVTSLSSLTANPTASVGLTAVNGAASTFMRSDAAPALSQAISPTWTGSHTFANTITSTVSGATGTALNVTGGGTTGIRMAHVGATGTDFYVGVASSTGGTLITGSAAYSAELRNDAGFCFGVGSTKIATIDSNGITVNVSTLLRSSVALTNGAGAGAGSLTNAPVAGNPTKWVPINDNGTTRYIPCW